MGVKDLKNSGDPDGSKKGVVSDLEQVM